MYLKSISKEEENFFKCLERLDNSYELLVIVFKDLGLKMKRWDILRELNVMKFSTPPAENKYYNKYKKYILRVLDLSENEVRRYFLENTNIKDDFEEYSFQYEEKKLEEVKKEFMPFGISEKMCKLISFRELELEEKLNIRIKSQERQIKGFINKVKHLQSKQRQPSLF